MPEVIMPKMGDGMEEGILLSWLKKDGEQVAEGDVIAEIQTDKSAVEIEAEGSGMLRTQVPEGQTVPVGAVIATIGDGAGPQEAAVQPEVKATAVPAKEPEPAPARASAASSNGAQVSAQSQEARMRISPLARKIARDRGVDLHKIAGTGPNGRILEADIEEYIAKTPKSVGDAGRATTGTGERMSQLRQVIARRMVQSKTTIPHFYLTVEIDMGAAAKLRSELNSYDESLPSITFNDLVVKAAAKALVAVPMVNMSYRDGQVFVPDGVHVGVAVSLDDGLVVPVVRNADSTPLRRIAALNKDLIKKAREKKLLPNEYSGGTFTVSNMGPHDVESFAAIIDPSQGAILAVGSIMKKPVVLEDDSIAVRQRMQVTLSGDHRVMDGAPGLRFMQALKHALEYPLSLLE